jgi:hypothetical protein
MNTVEIELFGGPAHGMHVVIPGDPMDPPATYEMQQAPVRQEEEPRRLVYRRDFDTLGKTLWVYRYEEQAL